MKVVVWTTGIDQVAKFLSRPDLGFTLVHLPCLKIEEVAFDEDEWLERIESLSSRRVWGFTSQKAVLILKKYPKLWGFIQKDCVYSFGSKTLGLLHQFGLNVRAIPASSGQEFWHKLIALDPLSVKFAPGGIERAFDPKDLANVIVWNLYETRFEAQHIDGSLLGAEFLRIASEEWRGVVCFASPSAVKGFCKVFDPLGSRLGGALKALAIGETTAQEAKKYFNSVQVTQTLTLEALAQLALIQMHCGCDDISAQ